MLGTCFKDRRLLADLRYLQLLLAGQSHLQTEIRNLIAMRLKRPISPHVDLELQYHPITLALFQMSCSPLTTIVRIYSFLDYHYTLLATMLLCGSGSAVSSNKAKSHLGVKR